jgi:hypothetical protein
VVEHLSSICKALSWIPSTAREKKILIELPYDPANPFLSIYPKECKQGLKEIFAPMFTVAFFHSIQKTESGTGGSFLYVLAT